MTLRSERSSHPALSCTDGLAASTSDIVLLIGRILLGWIFVRSGYGKLFNVEAYAATFPVRGLPPFLAYIAVPVEFFGGIALILGLATRYVVLVMVVFKLLGRHVQQSTLQAHRRVNIRHVSHTEIDNLHRVIFHYEDVAGFEIAMH